MRYVGLLRAGFLWSSSMVCRVTATAGSAPWVCVASTSRLSATCRGTPCVTRRQPAMMRHGHPALNQTMRWSRIHDIQPQRSHLVHRRQCRTRCMAGLLHVRMGKCRARQVQQGDCGAEASQCALIDPVACGSSSTSRVLLAQSERVNRMRWSRNHVHEPAHPARRCTHVHAVHR